MELHAQLLEHRTDLPSAARDSVTAIRREARQLMRMISTLLDLSKAEEGHLAPKASDCNIRTLVEEVLGELGANAADRDVNLRSSIEVERIHADRDLIQRVLANLVENAIRYSPRQATVTVVVSAVPDGTELRVADAGRGIAPESREEVFNAFAQLGAVDERSVLSGSRGLGLTFCRLATEAHGGRIWVEDARPGAIFCMTLPNAA